MLAGRRSSGHSWANHDRALKRPGSFQALSAFTGAGFTTRESEEIVNHPLRRRIVMHLMLLGHGGIVIAVASVMLSFLNTSSNADNWTAVWWVRLFVLTIGVAILWTAANSRYVERVTWVRTNGRLRVLDTFQCMITRSCYAYHKNLSSGK